MTYYDKYNKNKNQFGLLASVSSCLKNYLNNKYYVDVKDKRYFIRPNKNIILEERDPPKSLRTEYQVQKEPKFRKKLKTY